MVPSTRLHWIVALTVACWRFAPSRSSIGCALALHQDPLSQRGLMAPKGAPKANKSPGKVITAASAVANKRSTASTVGKTDSKRSRRDKKTPANLGVPAASFRPEPCRGCNSKPGTKRWARHAKAGPNELVAVGDACEPCYTFAQEGWPDLSWEEYCEYKEGVGRREVSEAIAAKAGSAAVDRSYLQDQVEGTCSSLIEVRTSMVILNPATEYKSIFGKNMTTRSPKVPSLTLPPTKFGAEPEQVLCFANPLQPFRTVELVQQFSDSKKTTRMHPEQNLYESHGSRMFSFCSDARHESMHPDKWTSRDHGMPTLPSMQEHAEKLGPESVDQLQGALAQFLVGAQVPVPVEADERDAEDANAANSLVVHAEPPSALRRSLSEMSSTIATPRRNPKAEHRTTESPQASPRSDGRLPNHTDVEADDSVSQVAAGSAAEDFDVRKVRTSRERLHVLKGRLDITAVMRGEKLGRSEHNCRLYLNNKKLDDVDAKLLKQHMQLASALVHLMGLGPIVTMCV